MTTGLLLPRQAVFVSHANPEDNEFATWLSLQLAQLGYTVWCDVVHLHGGEDFWIDIEAAIRDHTAKFLFVLSSSSNTKPGPLKELAVASITASRNGLRDFVIPLRIDAISHGDMNIELARLNATAFYPNWATGFGSLIKKLEEDGIPRSTAHHATVVSTWWRQHHSASEGVTQTPERHASNWFQIAQLPAAVFFHEISRSDSGPTLPEQSLPLPAVRHNNYLLSLAEADLFRPVLPSPYEVRHTVSVPFSDFAGSDWKVANIERRERTNIVIDLLRQSWELFASHKQVSFYNLSGKRTCIFLSHVEGVTTKIHFVKSDGTQGFRGLTGYKTVVGPSPDAKRKRHWHFAISARPLTHPHFGFALYAHVLFSDNGYAIWESKERLHAARRSQCKNWWNSDWRDRIMAFLAYLADADGMLRIPAGECDLIVPIQPVSFMSQVGYKLTHDTISPYGEGEEDTEMESDMVSESAEESLDDEEGTIDG